MPIEHSETKNTEQIERNNKAGMPSYRLSTKAYGSSSRDRTVVNFDDDFIGLVGLRRFPYDGPRGPAFEDMQACPYCGEPRYWERIISYHIAEQHPEELATLRIIGGVGELETLRKRVTELEQESRERKELADSNAEYDRRQQRVRDCRARGHQWKDNDGWGRFKTCVVCGTLWNSFRRSEPGRGRR